jgi:hypothetical protein
MTPWFSFDFIKSRKYSGTYSRNIKLAKTFSTTIVVKEIEYPLKNSKMRKDMVLASSALRL